MGDFITADKVMSGTLTQADLVSARLNVISHLEGLIEERGSQVRVKQILDIIYEENSVKDIGRILAMLSEDCEEGKGDFSPEEINLIEASWNIFPHKSLGGKCPLEFVPEIAKREEKASKKKHGRL